MRLPPITPPFFEIGPKNYIYGDEVLRMAKIADKTAAKYDVRVIFTAPYANIEAVAKNTKNLIVFTPHFDLIPVGRGIAKVLPESVHAAGARGVFLNHCECPQPLAEISSSIQKCRELKMYSLVCADSMPEIKAVAQLGPDIIIAEPTDVIGSGKMADMSYVTESIEAIHAIDSDISILVGGGISSGEDVYRTILAGADATGTSSGIFKAADPEKMTDEMLRALREAWNERHKGGAK